MQGVQVLTTTAHAADLEARFAAFVTSHADRARRLAWRLVGGDAAAADDVAQDAFLNAWRGLHRFRGDASLDTWFYRILVRQAASHRRWRAVRDRFGGRVPEDPPGGSDTVGDPALRRRIALALDRLSRGQREVFVLVHLEGFSIAEAAEVLGKAPGTLKSHLHRALSKLREELRDLAPEAPGEPS